MPKGQVAPWPHPTCRIDGCEEPPEDLIGPYRGLCHGHKQAKVENRGRGKQPNIAGKAPLRPKLHAVEDKLPDPPVVPYRGEFNTSEILMDDLKLRSRLPKLAKAAEDFVAVARRLEDAVLARELAEDEVQQAIVAYKAQLSQIGRIAQSLVNVRLSEEQRRALRQRSEESIKAL